MLCYRCMRDKGEAEVCPHCNQKGIRKNEDHHLAPGTVINNRYTIGNTLGEGGFGITYIGLDNVLDLRVAVKEYYPFGFSNRNTDRGNHVTVSAGDKQAFYDKGKSRFLQEARHLAKFNDEVGIVSVRDFFEENNTAYIVMNYLDGIDLRHYLKQNGNLKPEQAFSMLRPIMVSLEAVNNAGIIHRDISPDNIMCLKNGKIKLMDFGSARDFDDTALRSTSIMLKPGYSPEEQYRKSGKLGPWTDVYGLCATIYRCITGKTPDEALDRAFEDSLKKPSELGVSISSELEKVLMYGLAVRKNDRCQNMTELMALIDQATGSSADAQTDSYRTVYADSVTQRIAPETRPEPQPQPRNTPQDKTQPAQAQENPRYAPSYQTRPQYPQQQPPVQRPAAPVPPLNPPEDDDFNFRTRAYSDINSAALDFQAKHPEENVNVNGVNYRDLVNRQGYSPQHTPQIASYEDRNVTRPAVRFYRNAQRPKKPNEVPPEKLKVIIPDSLKEDYDPVVSREDKKKAQKKKEKITDHVNVLFNPNNKFLK